MGYVSPLQGLTHLHNNNNKNKNNYYYYLADTKKIDLPWSQLEAKAQRPLADGAYFHRHKWLKKKKMSLRL